MLSVKRLPPLTQNTASSLLVRHTFLAVASGSLLFHYGLTPQMPYKYFDTQLKPKRQSFETEIILMEPQHIGVLYRERQIICVFLLDNPKSVFKCLI